MRTTESEPEQAAPSCKRYSWFETSIQRLISLEIVEAARSTEPSAGVLCSILVTWAGWVFPESGMEQK